MVSSKGIIMIATNGRAEAFGRHVKTFSRGLVKQKRL